MTPDYETTQDLPDGRPQPPLVGYWRITARANHVAQWRLVSESEGLESEIGESEQ
jgi:hypothetical protein